MDQDPEDDCELNEDPQNSLIIPDFSQYTKFQ